MHYFLPFRQDGIFPKKLYEKYQVAFFSKSPGLLWGEAGNERIGNYPYQATITFTNALFYQNGVVVPQNGGGQIDYAVENISWETTRTSDVGIDACLFAKQA